MSGSSYNYLCHESGTDLFGDISGAAQEFERMASDIAALGYANDVASTMEELLAIVRGQSVRIDARFDLLKPLLHAMEWWKSCDWSEDQFKEALSAWRGEDGDADD